MMRFTREQLYKEIWESSALQVANKYRLNYQKLLKKCKEVNIPLPSSKYLYNKRQGLDIENFITPFVDSKIIDIEVENQKSRTIKKDISMKSDKDNFEKIIEVNSNQNLQSNKILFDKETFISSLDFLDEGKRNFITDSLTNFEFKQNKKLHKKVVSYKERIVTWNKRVKAANRDYYDPNYQRNDLTQPQFIKEVSKEQFPRLYRLLDTLCTIFENVGEKVTDDFNIQIGKDMVRFEIIESTDKIKHEITKDEAQLLVEYNDEVKRHSYASKPNVRKYDYTPNGVLRIKLSNGKYIKDTKSKQLEEMLPEIIILFYQCYFEIRKDREEWEEKERVHEEERQEARKIQERIDQEKKKTKELLNIISDYKLAAEIREYVSILKKNNSADPATVEWMLKKADWIDPIISSEDELLGKREHNKTEEEKNNALNSKHYYW
ncbi:cellulose synthase [Lactococcus lactis]|uniref:cellulose synthase n=1 Tax=Lactococcus lactis TaxID=1358 RepID=UPI0018A9B2A7|nr:cellulose synthase [Lactococcus lactis]